MRNNKIQQGVIIAAVAAVVALSLATRLFTNLPNFAPFGAIALFAGAYMANRKNAFILPLAALFASDLLIEITQPGNGFYPEMAFVYASYMLTIVLGFGLRSKRNLLKTAGFSIAASLLFFVVSNFGVWMMQDIYPNTAAGLITCYTMAIPFIKNTLISDLSFSAIFFGAAFLYEARLQAA